jgi:hypothetical protein
MKRVLLVLAALLPATLHADDVFLKGGGKVSGRILARTATSVQIDVGAGTVTLPMSRVERIKEGQSALQTYYARAGALVAEDAAGWKELARWASAQGLATQAREAYERVLRIDPADPDANRARGNVELEGRWVSEAESYRARGYVEFEGRWMTPAEQESILRQRAADLEARQSQRTMDAQVREAEARAREAEARAQAAEAGASGEYVDEGIPLWWGGGYGPGPGIWPPIGAPGNPGLPGHPGTPPPTRPGRNPPQTKPQPQPTPAPTPVPARPHKPPPAKPGNPPS